MIFIISLNFPTAYTHGLLIYASLSPFFFFFLNCRCTFLVSDLSLGLKDVFAHSLPATQTERTDIKYYIKGRFASPSFLAGSYFSISFSPRGCNIQFYYLLVCGKGDVTCRFISLTSSRKC